MHSTSGQPGISSADSHTSVSAICDATVEPAVQRLAITHGAERHVRCVTRSLVPPLANGQSAMRAEQRPLKPLPLSQKPRWLLVYRWHVVPAQPETSVLHGMSAQRLRRR